jgi:WD40 repeat protein
MSEHELLKFIGPLHRIPVESMPNLRRDVEKRQWWRVVRWASAAVLVIAALASLAGIAFYQMKLAKTNQRLAEERATVAESRRLATGAESQSHTDPEASLALALKGALVARTDDAINSLRDALPRSRPRLRVQGGNGTMSDDGRSVATAVPYSKDVVSVWDVATRRVRFTLHLGEVSYLVFSPDGRRLLTSTWARPIVAWDAIDGRQLQALGPSRLPPQVSHDSRRVLTADFEHRVHLWDLESGEELATFSGHSDEITDMRFSPDDKLVATSSNDHTVKLWDAAGKKLLRTITHKEKVWSVRFDSLGEVVVSASGDVARVWDVRNGRLKNSVEGLLGGENVVFEAEISAHSLLGGPILLHERGRCTFWNPSLADLLERSIRPVLELKSDQNVEGTPCMVSPDGGLVATGEGLWNLETKEKTADFLHAGGSSGGAVKFSQDGQFVLVARGYETEVWAVGPESPAATLEASGSQLLAGALALTMAVSPDKTRAAFVSGKGQLAVWNLSTRKKLWELQAHTGGICDVTFNADGTKLLSGGEDQAVRLWDAPKWEEVGGVPWAQELGLARGVRTGPRHSVQRGQRRTRVEPGDRRAEVFVRRTRRSDL